MVYKLVFGIPRDLTGSSISKLSCHGRLERPRIPSSLAPYLFSDAVERYIIPGTEYLIQRLPASKCVS